MTVSTLHGTLCLVRALIFRLGLLQIVLMCNLVENFIFRLFVCLFCLFVCLFVFVLVSICHMFRHSIVDLVEYSIKRSKYEIPI